MKKLIVLAFLCVFFLAVHSSFAAEVPCQPLYGGGDSGCSSPSNPQQKSTQQLSITKEIMRPGKGGDFVKTLNSSDPKFAPDEQIIFRLTLKNMGNQIMQRVTVVDTLPQYIDLVTGQGTYNNAKRTLTFPVDNLETGKPQVFYLTTKASSIQSLPSDKSIVCVSNIAKATDSAGKTVQDTTQACIQNPNAVATRVTPVVTKPIVKVVVPTPKPTTTLPSRLPTPVVYTNPNLKQTPPTGPEMAVLPLLGATGLAGYFLRRKAQ